MQSELTPQAVAAWLRERGKRYIEMANDIEAPPNHRVPNTVAVADWANSITTITPQQLEDRIRERSGRIKDVAAHFQASEASIRGLLEPASKVYVGERGWLKVRQ